MIGTGDVDDMIGVVLLDRDDARIGEIRDVVVDDGDEPVWAVVRAEAADADVLVPLAGAGWEHAALRAPVSGSSARTAPAADAAPSQQQEDQLFRHYGIPHACAQREDLDLSAFDDADVSYSVSTR